MASGTILQSYPSDLVIVWTVIKCLQCVIMVHQLVAIEQ